MSTIWDKIYQDYKRGKVHAVLKKEDILPDFKTFLETSDFNGKTALDIGCGRGGYLRYLENLGFTVSGIDSSSTAVALSKNLLSTKANVVEADMFGYDIPKNKFDLIFSISAIHHGKKKEINKLINQIISAILPNGKMFITLPVYPEKGLIRNLCGQVTNLINRVIYGGLPNRREIISLPACMDMKIEEEGETWNYLGDGVLMPICGPEKGLIHSFYKKKEVDKLFFDCHGYTIKRKGGEWIIEVTK